MIESYSALIIATVSVAVVHSLAPDHWLPFVLIARARGWSKRKLSCVTLVAGIAHVGSSVVLGVAGILLGIAAIHLQGIEAVRGQIGLFLLIGFGLTYAIWGLKHSQNHHHYSFELSNKRIITLWTLFTVFVLGPCEPLIPLMFLATGYGVEIIVLVTVVFTATTLAMMVLQALGSFSGVHLVSRHVAEKYSHAAAGFIIALTGAFLLVL